MPVEFEVLTDPNVVYIRYSGHIKPSDITSAVENFAKASAGYSEFPHLLNLSDVTGFTIDYPEFFKLLGRLADVYPESSGERLFVFLAPPGPPAELAAAIRVPLDRSDSMLIRVASGPDEALDILGLQHPALRRQLDPTG